MHHDVAGQAVAAVGLLAALGYHLAATRLRSRGDRWPVPAQAAFLVGCLALWLAGLGPGTDHGTSTDAMVRHLLLGMVAPLLLVLGRPVTLALRALPAGPVRRGFVRALHSAPVSVLVCPPVAAVLDAGGMWVLFRTPLPAWAASRPWLALLVHAHVLGAGLLFSAAVCQLDPVRRRYGVVMRGAALVAAAAAHGVLAKLLWAQAGTVDARQAAMIMYYGGDIVEIALAAVLAAGWYAAGGRALRRGSAGARCGTGSSRCLEVAHGDDRLRPVQ
ncbi:cytochrome c oxidase assembly protein [Luedemannella helvata]|uniref:Cytochrome c oxidase assembly protein n=1 Tax=Luedemannella helvata TaxID=349315 RepID=A0ABP4WMR7_9ACTN